jgi:oxalate decarboxylase/phosphoglucose isomerase-like protein (cupin superfamily)
MAGPDAHDRWCDHCPLWPPRQALDGTTLDAPVEVRRVADLLRPGVRSWFPRSRAVMQAAAGQVMYRATRDVLPARTAARQRWRADLVSYAPGVLPGGEFHRSIGHWNPPEQCEIFQVIHGRVTIITHSPEGRSAVTDCSAGDCLAVPVGHWHLTYVTGTTAVVFNLYTDTPAGRHEEKYARKEPVPIWLRATPDGPVVSQPARLSRIEVSKPSSGVLAPGECLAERFVAASQAGLAALAGQIATACEAHEQDAPGTVV